MHFQFHPARSKTTSGAFQLGCKLQPSCTLGLIHSGVDGTKLVGVPRPYCGQANRLLDRGLRGREP